MISRRDFIAVSAIAGTAFVCPRNACGAAEDRSGECFCDPHLLPPDAYEVQGNVVSVIVDKALPLQTLNTSAWIRDDSRDLRILVVHEGQGKWHAFSSKCTHGGSPVSYDPDRRRVQCVCYGHSAWSMEGALLKGPAKKPLPKYAVSVEGGKVRIQI